MYWHVRVANEEQTNKLFEKHCKSIIKYSFTPDDDDYIDNGKENSDDTFGKGFVSLNTSTGIVISYQFSKNSRPAFVEFKGFGLNKDIRYDVHYPIESHLKMAEFLKEWGELARKEFLKGAEI